MSKPGMIFIIVPCVIGGGVLSFTAMAVEQRPIFVPASLSSRSITRLSLATMQTSSRNRMWGLPYSTPVPSNDAWLRRRARGAHARDNEHFCQHRVCTLMGEHVAQMRRHRTHPPPQRLVSVATARANTSRKYAAAALTCVNQLPGSWRRGRRRGNRAPVHARSRASGRTPTSRWTPCGALWARV